MTDRLARLDYALAAADQLLAHYSEAIERMQQERRNTAAAARWFTRVRDARAEGRRIPRPPKRVLEWMNEDG